MLLIKWPGATSTDTRQAKVAGAALIHCSTTSAPKWEQMVSFGSILLAEKHPFD